MGRKPDTTNSLLKYFITTQGTTKDIVQETGKAATKRSRLQTSDFHQAAFVRRS
jgi:hypothetical protein